MKIESKKYFIISGIISSILLATVGTSSSTTQSKTCAIKANPDYLDKLGCPVWYKPGDNNGSCECGNEVRTKLIHCDSCTKTTVISKEACITLDEDSGKVYGGYCPYNSFASKNTLRFWPQIVVPQNISDLNEAMCGPLNRTGLLCSKCKEGLGPPVLSYSSKCIKCLDSRYAWFVYVLVALGPVTVFCIIIITCRIDATTPTLNLAIMLSQIIADNRYRCPSVYNLHRLNWFIKFGLAFYGLWNLNMFRNFLPSFCISSKMNTLQLIALEYLEGLYPLVLTAVVYYCIEFHDRGYRVILVLWRPFHPFFARFRSYLDIRGSIINVFATFLFLSYSRLLNSSFGFLTASYVYDACGNKYTVAYNEPSMQYFNTHHLPYALLGLTVILVCNILPLVYIVFYQNSFFQRCLGTCRIHITLLSELAKVCQKSFKDGLDGTKDYRWYAGVYLIYRFMFHILSIPYVTTYLHLGNILVIAMSGLTTFLCAVLQPYKKRKHNIFDSVVLGIFTFGILYYCFMFPDNVYHLSLIPIFFIASLPLVYILCFITFQLLHKTGCIQVIKNVKNKIKAFYIQSPNPDEFHWSPRLEESIYEHEPLLQPFRAESANTQPDA